MKDKCREDLLNYPDDPKIRMDFFHDCVFSSNPKIRAEEKQYCLAQKGDRDKIKALEEQSKLKAHEAIERRKKQATDDFNKCFLVLQYPKGTMTSARLKLLRNVIQFATEILA